MTRTFHQRFTIGFKAGVILLTLLTIYFFWIKSPVPGLLLVILTVIVTERMLHSEYVFQDDKLLIYRGKFLKPKTIPLSEMHSCRPMITNFGMVHFLLIEYGDDRQVFVQPAEETAFIKFLQDRIAALARRNHADEADLQD